MSYYEYMWLLTPCRFPWSPWSVCCVRRGGCWRSGGWTWSGCRAAAAPSSQRSQYLPFRWRFRRWKSQIFPRRCRTRRTAGAGTPARHLWKETLTVVRSRRVKSARLLESQSLGQTLVWFWSYRCPGATAAGAPWHRRTAICLSTGCWQSVRRGSGPRGPGPGTAPPAARSAFVDFWWPCAARRWLAGGKPRWFVVSLRCWRASQCFWWPGWCPCCCFLHGLKQKQSFSIIENCQWKKWKLAVTVYEDLKGVVCSLGTWHYLWYVLLFKNLFG